jgi:hypothetical protein
MATSGPTYTDHLKPTFRLLVKAAVPPRKGFIWQIMREGEARATIVLASKREYRSLAEAHENGSVAFAPYRREVAPSLFPTPTGRPPRAVR